MTGVRVYISSLGVVSCLGNGILQTTETLEKGRTGIRPLTLFSTPSQPPLPVGEFSGLFENNPLPRTHQLAQLAADQAMAGCDTAPDAVVLGVTTGGMLSTETLLKKTPATRSCSAAMLPARWPKTLPVAAGAPDRR